MAHDTKNFKVNEFACKCGCGFNIIDQKTMDMAQKIRAKLDMPVHVNSGCRCEKHNARVGGVKGSQHTLGKAADLSCSLGVKRMLKAIKELYASGELEELRYCKEYNTFIHVDCGKKRKSIWDLKS